jgi:hypothetical protein
MMIFPYMGLFQIIYFNQHYGFRNKLTLKYLFYNILNDKVKYKNSLLFNYNYIHNKELYDTPRAGQRSLGYQTGFPEIIWLARDKNSKIKFNLSFLPFQKNKISFNFFWNLNDADVKTIKNYKLKLLKKNFH